MNGSSDVPPAFSDLGSKPAPMPALEQNKSIGPNSRSVSSMTWRMSFSCATSHLNAAPPTDAATACAAAMSRSATTTLAAPAQWKTSQSARPMPLPPPVTTTTLSFTCIDEPDFWKLELNRSSGEDEIEHGRIMARRAEQHEAMPDHVLKAKPLPCMEHYPE